MLTSTLTFPPPSVSCVAPLHVAALRGSLRVAELLLAGGADATRPCPYRVGDFTRRFFSFRPPNGLSVEPFVPRVMRLDPDDHGGTMLAWWSPIHCAALCDAPPAPTLIKRLLTAGAYVDAPGGKAFPEICEHGPHVPSACEGATPLTLASIAALPHNVAALIEGGADVNAVTIHHYGVTPLLAAVEVRHFGPSSDGVESHSEFTVEMSIANVDRLNYGGGLEQWGCWRRRTGTREEREAVIFRLIAAGADPTLAVPDRAKKMRSPISSVSERGNLGDLAARMRAAWEARCGGNGRATSVTEATPAQAPVCPAVAAPESMPATVAVGEPTPASVAAAETTPVATVGGCCMS